MADWKPELHEDDLEYVLSLMKTLKAIDKPDNLQSVEPINVYSDADPIGYIANRVHEGQSYYYFVAGDRYKDD